MGGPAAVSAQSGSNPCGMQMNQQPVIFCDTFDSPNPVFNRSGQLNGTVWGVSRAGGNGGALWYDGTIEGCNGPQAASAVGASDVIICNGQLREMTNDGHDVTMLAMYPKQPFDFNGRIGTVSFDVSNDTTGGHGAWPEFWITDLPVPAPTTHLVPCDFCSVPKNGFGIRFDANMPKWRAGSISIIRDYVIEEHGIFDNNATGVQIREKGSVTLSPGPNGPLNHVELRIAQDRIEIYASDAGSKTLKLINTVENANLPITRGLIWIQDGHYNAEKAHEGDPSLPDQRIHTYTWDNVAFDGPATYRDLSFDVLDRNLQVSPGTWKLGWDSSPGNPATVTTLPMTADNIAAATKAFLLFNFGGFPSLPTTFTYSINGHQNSYPGPAASSPYMGKRNYAIPVTLSDLVQGPQQISLQGNVPFTIQNVNIVLVAAAPVPPVGGFGPVPTPPRNLRILQ
jgi:hypothetical protein